MKFLKKIITSPFCAMLFITVGFMRLFSLSIAQGLDIYLILVGMMALFYFYIFLKYRTTPYDW